MRREGKQGEKREPKRQESERSRIKDGRKGRERN